MWQIKFMKSVAYSPRLFCISEQNSLQLKSNKKWFLCWEYKPSYLSQLLFYCCEEKSWSSVLFKGNFRKKKHLIGCLFAVLKDESIFIMAEAWQQSSRHGIGVAADLTSDPQQGIERREGQTDRYRYHSTLTLF